MSVHNLKPEQVREAAPTLGPILASARRREAHKPGWTSGLPDRLFRGVMLLAALSVLFIVVLVVKELVTGSRQTLHQFGWRFFLSKEWDPVAGDFGALPFIYGTLVTPTRRNMIRQVLGTQICKIRLG